MLILGIETACDDTSAAIVEDGKNVLSNIVWTQNQVHQRFGGVVPELAARRHIEAINYVIQAALDKANVSFQEIHAVGVNCRHGLLRSIMVGVAAAKAIAYSQGIPLIGVHHIEGHIYSNLIAHPDLEFPHICLTVSGGHNLLIHVHAPGKYELIGRTWDDSAGEAFDKVSKVLGLGFPGGPIIDNLSQQGNAQAFDFPRPMLNNSTYDFSFSGLKTAVTTRVAQLKATGNELNIADIAASFQQAVVDVLVTKTLKAAENKGISIVSVAGGVSANSLLRKTFAQLADQKGIKVICSDISLCTDNGAMIAALAYYKYQQGYVSSWDLDAMANAPLGDLGLIYKKPLDRN
jgi:N6-L-threonylcarbamoyladenine synthase